MWFAPANRSLALFSPEIHRHGRDVLGDVAVDVEHPRDFFGRFLLGRVRGVTFLPQEFQRAQERPRALFPAHDVGPLVDEDRQIAVRLHPLGVHRADDHFGGRADREPLGQLFAAAFGHPRDFRREALDVLGFAHQQRLGDQQREVGVLVPGLFEPAVEFGLQTLPQAVPVGTQDEATADGRLRDELRPVADGLIPL